MLRGYVKQNEGYVIFYIKEFGPTVVDQLDLLKQVCNLYGKVLRAGNCLFLKPKEEARGQELTLLHMITREFNFLWTEYENIPSRQQQPDDEEQ